MTITPRRPGAPIFALAVLLGLAAPSTAGAQAPQLTMGETYQDWTSGCESKPESPTKACFIFQKLTNRETGKEQAAIAIGYADPAQPPVAVLTLPLGMLLPPGVLLKIPNLPPRPYPVQFCMRDSCRSHIPLSPEMVNALKVGSSAEMAIRDLGGREVTLAISLKGFTKAFTALK